jgi:hypothetical protein
VHCINSLPVASHDFLNYLAIKHSGNYVDLTSLSSVDAAKLLKGDVNRFQGIEDNSYIDQVYPLAGTPVSTNLFSLVGRATSLPQTITLKFGPSADNITERINLTISDNSNKFILADKLWAQKAITSLEYNYEDNKDEVDGLGARFGIATKGTSLIVLENLNDYIRFGIVPPADLKQQYNDIQKRTQSDLTEKKRSGLDKLQSFWTQLQTWWNDPKADPVGPSSIPSPSPVPMVWVNPRPTPIIRNTGTSNTKLGIRVAENSFSGMGAGVGVGGRASSVGASPSFSPGASRQFATASDSATLSIDVIILC